MFCYLKLLLCSKRSSSFSDLESSFRKMDIRWLLTAPSSTQGHAGNILFDRLSGYRYCEIYIAHAALDVENNYSEEWALLLTEASNINK